MNVAVSLALMKAIGIFARQLAREYREPMFGREDAAGLRHSPILLELLAFPSPAESALCLILRICAHYPRTTQLLPRYASQTTTLPVKVLLNIGHPYIRRQHPRKFPVGTYLGG